MTLETALYLSLFTLYGVLIGSFLNVCIYRIPKRISIAAGRSFCPTCHHTLGARDLIPVFSFLFLHGKCRHCGARISPRYPLVETLTGALFCLCFLRYGLSVYTVLLCLVCAILVCVAFIDYDTGEIPDRLHVALLLPALVHAAMTPADWLSHLLGVFIVSLPMLLLALLTGGFGGGDIKLMAAAGLFLGAYPTLLAFFIGAFLAAVIGIFRIATKKAGRKSQMAFGPYLSIGIFFSALYFDNILHWYLAWIWRIY